MFGIGGCEELKSSIVWVQRHEKCEHQMKRCVADQKVSDWQMTPCVTVLLWMATVAQLNPPDYVHNWLANYLEGHCHCTPF